MRWSQILVLFVVLAVGSVTLTSTSAAQEQQEPSTQDSLLGYGLSTTTTGVVLSAGGGLALTTVMLLADDDETTTVQTYLRENTARLQHDLYIGGGETLEDLAAIYDVPGEQFDAFARGLYERRNELIPLVRQGTVDRKAAHHFGHIVAESAEDERSTAGDKP